MPYQYRAGLSLALFLALAACGGAGESGTSRSDPPPTATAGTATTATTADSDHNRSDVEFARDMVPHHEQAFVVADLALERASSPEVKDLARRIKPAQDGEMKQLLVLLKLWGEAVTPGGAGGEHEHSHLMSEEEFQRLRQATGARFDELWLRSMIEHHRGAVDMAEAQLRDGSDALASLYARNIVDRQSKEIEEMTALLER